MADFKRPELKVGETDKHDYFLVDTEHKKFKYKGNDVSFDVYNKPSFLDQLIAQGFEYLEKREKTKQPSESIAKKN